MACKYRRLYSTLWKNVNDELKVRLGIPIQLKNKQPKQNERWLEVCK